MKIGKMSCKSLFEHIYTGTLSQFVGQQFVGQQFVGQQFVGQQFVGQQFVGQQFVPHCWAIENAFIR